MAAAGNDRRGKTYQVITGTMAPDCVGSYDGYPDNVQATAPMA